MIVGSIWKSRNDGRLVKVLAIETFHIVIISCNPDGSPIRKGDKLTKVDRIHKDKRAGTRGLDMRRRRNKKLASKGLPASEHLVRPNRTDDRPRSNGQDAKVLGIANRNAWAMRIRSADFQSPTLKGYTIVSKIAPCAAVLKWNAQDFVIDLRPQPDFESFKRDLELAIHKHLAPPPRLLDQMGFPPPRC